MKSIKKYVYKFIDTSFNPDREHEIYVTAENVTVAFADANLDELYVLYEVKPSEDDVNAE